MLLSFERPATRAARSPIGEGCCVGCGPSADLENCTAVAKNGYHRAGLRARSHHRQDSKGTRWMPWHQESMKGVNGCEKPRVGAE